MKENETILPDLVYDVPQSKPVTVIVGRFQPITLGHVRLLEKAAEIGNHIAMVIVKPSKTAGDRSPFTTFDQRLLIDELVQDRTVYLWVHSGFIGNFINPLRRYSHLEPTHLICGSDRAEGYLRQINNYEKKLNLNLEVIEVERDDDDVSATMVREALKSKDEITFKKLMPEKLHGFFEPLTEKIWQSHPQTKQSSAKPTGDSLS